MSDKLTLKFRVIFTGVVTLLVWANLAWDYLHEGVPTHYILHSKDLPGFSNWWGGIAIPLVTWFLLSRIVRRTNNNKHNANDFAKPNYRFLGALSFGIILSVLFTLGSDLPAYMMLAAILVSFFVPLYKTEYLLGFIIGMTYTFGGILPIIIGLLLFIIFMVTYKLIRSAVIFLVSKIGTKSTE
jgi:hypothetical protein